MLFYYFKIELIFILILLYNTAPYKQNTYTLKQYYMNIQRYPHINSTIRLATFIYKLGIYNRIEQLYPYPWYQCIQHMNTFMYKSIQHCSFYIAHTIVCFDSYMEVLEWDRSWCWRNQKQPTHSKHPYFSPMAKTINFPSEFPVHEVRFHYFHQINL